MSLHNIINDHLRCAITLERPALPMNCPCGHLFESAAIYNWLRDNHTCPISRQPLNSNQLTFNNTVYQLLQAINISEEPTREITTQTTSIIHQKGDDSIEVEHEAVIPAMVRPFVYCGDLSVTAMQLGDQERDYLANDLLVPLGEHTFNPQSTNIRLEPVVDFLNKSFIDHLIPHACNNPHIVVRKYAYQNKSDSLVEVAKILLRAGYYVYDLFMIHQGPELCRYVLYSCDVKDDGSPNLLSKYRRISERL